MTHQVIPSVADYGLAQAPLRIEGVHGQQPQAGIALEQWRQLLLQHPGFVPLLRCGHNLRSWASTFTMTRGFPLASSDCLAHLP